MTISTSGTDQNSLITISECNALLLTMAASFQSADPTDDLLEDDGSDDRYLIEAAGDLDTMWRWAGLPSDLVQNLSWPRRWVMRPGFNLPPEPGWNDPCSAAEFLEYKIIFLSGQTNGAWLDDTIVPQRIKEAQALLAVLRKQGGNLIGDNQGDDLGTKLGPITVSYVNAVRNSADIHKRTAQYGTFIGEGIARTNPYGF